MKIEHLNTESVGGAYAYAKRLSDVLCDFGHESKLYTKLHEGGVQNGPEGVWRVLQRGHYSLENRMLVAHPPSYYSRLVEFHATQVLQSEIDIAHLHWIGRWLDLKSFISSLPAQVPIVWTVHDMSPLAGGCFTDFGCREFGNGCSPCPLLKGPLKLWWARQELRRRVSLLRRRRVAFVANSESTLNLVRKSQVARGHFIEKIPPGFDFGKLENRDKSTAKARWGFESDSFVLGFVAATLTDENKGVARFQEVCRKVAREVPNTRALLVGDGCVSECVPSVKTGLLGDDALMDDAYSAMDALIVTSKMESFGQVSVEAQARGIPVWAFAVGGLPETLEYGKTGGLADFGDVDALAKSILSAHREGRISSMGEAARCRARDKFGIKSFAMQYIDLYKKLIDQEPNSP